MAAQPTADGTAQAGSDYVQVVSTAPGYVPTNVVDTGQVMEHITIKKDGGAEPDQYFWYSISLGQKSDEIEVDIENGGTAKITIPQNSL